MVRGDAFDSKTNLSAIRENISKSWRQHAGACTACFSAFVVGNTFGWSSLADPQLLKGAVGFPVAEKQCSLMDSLLTFGAAVSCFPVGYVTDKIGRKSTLLSSVPVFLLGWSLLIWPDSVDMLYAGRFILGISAGTVCVTAPVYATEICRKEIRGAAGSYFQMLLASGVLFAYVIGSELDLFWFSLACGSMPIVFGLLFLYFPDTPIYYLMRRDVKKARSSLGFFRGSDHDCESELNELSEYSNREECSSVEQSSWKSFASKQGMKGLSMSIGLMVFQQLSGINAFVFNATDIFQNAGSSLDARYETIIIGLMQVVGTLFVTLLVDKVGRIMLLGISAVSMSFCTFLLGIFFYMKESQFEIEGFSWIPLFSLSIFAVAFSVGFGAIPWMLISELMPAAIKGPGTSIACVTNWITAFIVTQFFFDLINIFGRSGTFWIFSAASVLAAIFTYTALPETKGKSFEAIQRQLGGNESYSEETISNF